MTAEMLMSLAAICAVIVSIYVAWRKTPAERMGLEAEAAAKWEQIAGRSAERMAALEQKVGELEAELSTMATEMQNLRAENERLRDWAERLVHQVQSLGLEPVKMKVQRQK